jgi:primary-amine oxidase
VEVLRSEHDLGDSHRFVAVTLHEPPKEKVLNHRDGEPVEREAILTVLDKSDGSTYEAVVSLTEGKITRWERIPGVHTPRLSEEYEHCERVCKGSPNIGRR